MRKIYCLLFIAFSFDPIAQGQITGSRIKLDPGTIVNIIMPDTTSEVSKKYMAVYKQYWTFSKYKFILPAEKQELKKQAGNYFFGFSAFKRVEYNSRSFKNELVYMQVFLNLYQCTKEEVKNSTYYIDNSLASFLLPMKDRSFFDKLLPGDFLYGSAYELDTSSYDHNGSLFLWGPGLLKNYIQKVGMFVKSKKAAEEDIKSSAVDNAADLSKLTSATLYVPDYCLMDYSMTSNTYKKELKEEEKIFGKYTLPYELISAEELNKKILDSEEEFFYLVYTSDMPRKYINIISSKTGKIIYSEFYALSYDFNKGDMKDLMKAVEGG